MVKVRPFRISSIRRDELSQRLDLHKLVNDLNPEKYGKKGLIARHCSGERKQTSTQYILAEPQVSHEVNPVSFS